jgi:predicted Fe-S protein YdhL (DUF1289 family)
MSPSGSHCIGCYRTLNEIATWIRLTNEQRRQVLAACDERRQSPGAGLDSGDLI